MNFREPIEDELEAFPRVVGTTGFEPGHKVIVREAKNGAAVLNLAAPGNGVGAVPDVGVPLDVAHGGGAGGKPPVVDVRAGGGVTLDKKNPLINDQRAFELVIAFDQAEPTPV